MYVICICVCIVCHICTHICIYVYHMHVDMYDIKISGLGVL